MFNHFYPFVSWNMSCDLAKLWRVAVLNPRLTKGNRDGMAHQLRKKARKSFAKTVSLSKSEISCFHLIELVDLLQHKHFPT